MITKQYNPKKLKAREAAAVLEVESSLVSRLFKTGRLKNYKDENQKFYTTRTDILEYLSSRLPAGFIAQAEEYPKQQ